MEQAGVMPSGDIVCLQLVGAKREERVKFDFDITEHIGIRSKPLAIACIYCHTERKTKKKRKDEVKPSAC